jgi:hypothetical protein
MIYNIKKEKVEIIRKEIKFINLYQLNNQSIDIINGRNLKPYKITY